MQKICKPISYLVSSCWLKLDLHFSSENATKQYFCIPKPIITYMCNNKKLSINIIYKLYKCCKYFYMKMKIVAVSSTSVSAHAMDLFSLKKQFYLNLSRMEYFDFKLRCMETLQVCGNDNNPKVLSDLLKMVDYCNIVDLYIWSLDITLKEFEFIASTVKQLSIGGVKVFRSDGSILVAEDIINICKNATDIFMYTGIRYTKQTAQNILQMNRPFKFSIFEMHGVPDFFDAASFSAFVKKNFKLDGKVTIRFCAFTAKAEKVKAFKAIVTKNFTAEKYKHLKIRYQS